MNGRTSTHRVILLALAAMILPLFDAEAIPAFARKYRQSCSTCHAPAPRLKPYGEEFAARGFRLEDPAQEPARATIDTGDDTLQLLREIPLAIRLDGFAAWNEGAAAEKDFEAPWVFKILSGSPLTDRLSYYFYFILEKNETEGLEDAYLHYTKLFGAIDVIAGQFQVSDPLFKRELRLERSDYEIYRVRVGQSRANLTYDRGLMLLGTAPGEVDVAFQVVNGNGIPKGTFDQDGNKNLALRLAKRAGPVRVGVFGYRGCEDLEDGRDNEVKYYGPDLAWKITPKAELNAQYLVRTDSDPFFTGQGPDEFETTGGFVEIQWFPRGEDGKWAWSALYNRIESDDPGVEHEFASLTLNRLLARNVRFLVEVGRDLEGDTSKVSFGLVTAF